MIYSDFAIKGLCERLAARAMKDSTPKKYAGLMLESLEIIRQLQRASAPPLNASQLDRDRWKGCDSCKSEVIKIGMKHVGYKFCPHCGKPVTEEAWAEMEQRIGGNT